MFKQYHLSMQSLRSIKIVECAIIGVPLFLDLIMCSIFVDELQSKPTPHFQCQAQSALSFQDAQAKPNQTRHFK